VDVAARLEAVENENEMLRARNEQLEEMLGIRTLAPISFGLTPSESKVFGILMKRDLATKEMVMLTLYGDRPDDNVEIKIVDVFVCKMRKKIKAHDVPIETVWGQGYRIAPEAKQRVRDMMRDEGMVV
jgi:DNA-binding response OmpR family regulator